MQRIKILRHIILRNGYLSFSLFDSAVETVQFDRMSFYDSIDSEVEIENVACKKKSKRVNHMLDQGTGRFIIIVRLD